MRTYNISNLTEIDILALDLEKLEFDMNYPTQHNTGIMPGEALAHQGFINFNGFEGEMYGNDEEIPEESSEDEEDSVFEDRDSYRNANMDDVYYFI